MPAPHLVPADAIPEDRLHALFLEAFADYVAGAPQLPLDQWPVLLARHCIDLPLGRVVVQDGEPVAFALVAPRPESGRWRLAAMGAAPAARGSGAAPALLADLAGRARDAGMRELELECFAQNERALRLYRRAGFAPVAELHGYDRPAVEGAATDAAAPDLATKDPFEVERASALAWLAEAHAAVPNVPLQTTARGLAAHGHALRTWRSGAALLAFEATSGGRVVIHALFDATPAGLDADALVATLAARARGRAIAAAPIHRDDLGTAALRRAGFARQRLHQLLMVASLDREAPGLPID